MSLMTDMLRQSIANSGVSVRVGDSRNLLTEEEKYDRSTSYGQKVLDGLGRLADDVKSGKLLTDAVNNFNPLMLFPPAQAALALGKVAEYTNPGSVDFDGDKGFLGNVMEGYKLGSRVANAGFGQLIDSTAGTLGYGIHRVLPNSGMDNTIGAIARAVGNYGDTMQKANDPHIENPNDSVLIDAANIAGEATVSLPTSIGLAVAGVGLGGAAVRGGAAALRGFPQAASAVAKAAGWADAAGNWVKSLPAVGRVAKNLGLPSPQNVVGGVTSGFLEGAMEGYEAYRQYIDDAKRNGTYVEGETEEAANRIADAVGGSNFALLAPVNTMEQMLLFGKGGKGVWKRLLGIAGTAGQEAFEEAAQQVIQNQQAAKEGYAGWDDYTNLEAWEDPRVGHAALVGMTMGGGMSAVLGGGADTEDAPAVNNAPTLTSGNAEIDDAINAAAAKHGLPADLLFAVAQTESDFDQSVVSEAGAKGIMQLMPDTAAALGVDADDIVQNIEGGARYLKQQLDDFGGNVEMALAAYNAGPGAVEKYKGVPPYTETQNYVAKIMGILDGANMNPATEVGAVRSLLDDAEPFIGTRMDNGTEGCVEAVTKIGAAGSDFLRAELEAGVVNVDRLVEDAGERVIPFDASRLEEGDVIVYGDKNDAQRHVVLYDGKGGYIGNSSSQNLVVHASDYNAMGSYYPTKIIKSGGRYGGTVNISSVSGSVRPIDYSGLVVDAKNLQANEAAMKALIDGDKLTPAQKAAIIDAAEIIRDTPTEASTASPAEDALDYNAWQRLIDHKDVKGIFAKDPERVTRMVMRGEETQRKAQTAAAIENQQKVAQAQAIQAQVQAAAQAQPVANPAESAARLASVQQELSLPPMAQQEIAARLASYAQTTPNDVERVVIQNGLAHGDFTGIARALPDVYRAAAGRWMQQPQEQAQPQPQTQPPQPTAMPTQQDMQVPNVQANDAAAHPSQGLAAQMPQQGQAQAVPTTEDLADIRQKLAALDTMMQGNPAYVEARRRGDWQTAAQEAAKAGHHDFARFYQMLHEKATGAPINVTPYQNPAEKAAAEQGAVRPTPAPEPINPVDTMRPVDIPKSYGARRDFGRGLIKAMRMRNLPNVKVLNDDLRNGEKRAIKHALKRIAQADAEDALLRGEPAAQRANDNETVQAESHKKQGDNVQVESAQKQGKEKTANEGGVVVTGKEFGEYRDIKELRKKALQYYKEYLQGTSVENALLGKIDIDDIGLAEFTGSGKRELKNSSAKEEKLLLVKHLPALIHNATDISGKKSSKESHAGEYFYYLHTAAEIQGVKTPVEITLIKRNNRTIQYYNHTLPSLEKGKKIESASVSTEPESLNGPSETPSIHALSSVSNIPSEQEKSKGKSVQAKSAPLTKQEQEALTGTSEEAKEAYRIVRDKLAKSKNKSVVRAAKVGATLFARHADIYAKAYSKATGKPYTALDYLHDKFGLDADGKEVDGRANGFEQRKTPLSDAERKKMQLHIIQDTNPMNDDIHTGVRSTKDILSAKEAFETKVDENSFAYPDFTEADGRTALRRGYVEIYSSHPIVPGAFVTPSQMQAKDYAGSGRVYSKRVPLRDVAWLHSDEGQYAPVEQESFDQSAWHGTPHYFKHFDLGAIGTGEGAQVHGWGLYFAEAKGTAMGYRSVLSEADGYIIDYYGDRYYKTNEGWLFNEEGDEYGEHSAFVDYTDPITKALDAFHEYGEADAAIESLKKELEDVSGYASDSEVEQIKGAIEILQNDGEGMELKEPGTLFEVEIPDDDVLLDEQLPYEEQPKKVQKALEQISREVASQGEGSPGASFSENYKEMDGREVYEALTDITGDPEETSIMLNEHGIQGITYDGRQDGRCFVVFDDEAIEVINKFNQSMNNMRKGSITPQASGRRVISLFEQADESTFLHEMGHMFLMDLEDIAALDEASAEDLETVRDWATWQEGQAKEYEDTPWQKEFAEREKAILAAKKRGDVVEVKKLRREWEQERFARGFERYLETGKAPTSVLKRIFLKFKKFLERIYQAFKGTGGKASPEAEAVMGRMIAEEQGASSEFEENPVQAKSAPIQADFSASKLKGATGRDANIVTDSGEEIPVRYRLVEALSLVTSNSAKDFSKNPAYPKSLQPRDRERANMQQQIREMASRLRPEDLAASRSVNLGAPVVRADGVVLNGNGRAIAITRALLGNTFRDSTGKGYRAFLVKHAEEFGFKPETVQRMKAPMLVREVTGGLNAEQVKAVTTSTAGGSRLGASEQAKQDAEKITLEDLARYEENERGDLTTAANRDFVAGILYRVAGKNDVNAYTDAKGQVNADGIQRVKRALFQKAYGDDDLLSRMSESTNDDTRNITNGLTIAAPYIARANEKMARGTAHSYKLGETIADAVKRYNHLHGIGQSVENYLDQQAMFAEYEDSTEVREVLRVLNENRRSGKRIAQFVRRVGEIVEAQGNPNEISLMEGGEPLSLGDVIREAQKGLNAAEAAPILDTLFQESPALKKAALEYGATEKDGEVTFENPEREKEFLRIAEALQGGVAKKLSAAWHGSPHEFDAFDLGGIGTGEGAQVHGWGLYFAKERKTSERYKKYFSKRRPIVHLGDKSYVEHADGDYEEIASGERVRRWSGRGLAIVGILTDGIPITSTMKQFEIAAGKVDDEADRRIFEEAIRILRENKFYLEYGASRLYKVEIPDNDVLLDEQKSFDEQPKFVQEKLQDVFADEDRYRKDRFADSIKRQEQRIKDFDIVLNENAAVEERQAAAERLSVYEVPLERALESEFRRNFELGRDDAEYYKEIDEERLENYETILKTFKNGKEIYKSLSMSHGGDKVASLALNDVGIKGITYDGQQDGRCYVIFDDKAIKILEKFSARRQEALSKVLKEVELVAPEKLSKRQQGIADFGKEMGMPVVFFKGAKNLHGFHASNGVTFLNTESETSLRWTFWHEALHWMKANNEELFKDIIRDVEQADAFTKAQFDGYRKAIGAPELSDADVIEEMLADALPDVKKRVPFLKDLGKRNKSLAERLVGWIRDVMDSFRDFFHTPARGLTTAQSTAMRNAFAALARDMVDERGRRIFRVDEFSRRITLANGSPLPSAKYSLDNREGRGDNEGKERKLTNRITIREDGGISITLKYPPKLHESQKVRIMRRKAEVRDIDAGLVKKGNRSAYVNLLSDRSRSVIDGRIARGESREDIAKEYLLKYNEVLANYSKGTPEEKVIGALVNLKGAMYYATDAGNLKGRDGRDDGAIARGQVADGQRVDEAAGQERAGAEDENRISDKHPETGAFSMVKFSRDNSKPGSTGRFRRLLVGLKIGEAAESNLEVHRSNKEKQLVMSAEKLNKFMADKALTEKNILKTEDMGGGKIRLTYMPQDFHNIHILDWLKSVRQLRKKNPFVKAIYDLGSRAMRLQEHLRNEGAKTVKEFRELTKNKNDRKLVSSILLEGDAAGKEYGVQELRAMGANANVIKAYQLVRRTMREWYKRVNDARMQVRTRTKTLSKNDLADFKKNHWIKDSDVLSVEEKGGGKILLTWRGIKTYETNDKVMTKEELDALLQDKDVNVTHFHKLNDSYGVDNYSVDYVERIKPLGNLTGYIPHFFHEWMVYEKHKDPKTGEVRLTTIGSGRSMNDAIRLGNDIARKNSDKEYVVRPKGFDLNVENSVVIGDVDFQQMAAKLAENTEMTLSDANAFLRDSAGAAMRARHRFFGNALHRTGAKGFDTDITYVLTHYFNTSARYIAMEQFKPRAITLYERWFGAFDADPKDATASYVKGLIKDINGDPRQGEKYASELIMATPFGKMISDAYGDRTALALNAEVSTWNAISKLGLGNFASAAVNFSQFINIAAAMNDYGYAAKGLKSALKPTAADMKILEESGVLDEINQAADNGGYTQRRFGRVGSVYGAIKRGGELSLLPFQYADVLMRKTAILGAYKQGVEKLGLSHEEAMERAREINYDANFDYSAANAPLMIRAGSVVTQQMFQFQKYPIMQMEFMYNILFHGTRGQKVRFFLPYVLLCGIPGMIPFGEIFNQIFSFFFGLASGDDKDIGNEIKAKALRWAEKDPAKKFIVNWAIYGVLAPTFGIDVSKRIGISGAFSGEFFGAQKPESVGGMLAMQLGGPAVSTAVNMQHQLHNGNPIEALKAFSPALGNMAQAMVGVSRTTRHRVKSRYETTYDRIIHAMGFRSVDESNNSFITSYEFDRKDAETHAKQEAIMDYLDDPSEANRQRINALGIKDKAIEEARIQQERSATERAKEGRPKVESGKTSKRRTSHKRKEEKPKKETLFDTIGEEDEGM